jgi:hypothetical protein
VVGCYLGSKVQTATFQIQADNVNELAARTDGSRGSSVSIVADRGQCSNPDRVFMKADYELDVLVSSQDQGNGR